MSYKCSARKIQKDYAMISEILLASHIRGSGFLYYRDNRVDQNIIYFYQKHFYTPENELNPPSTSNILPVTKLDASLNK